MLACLLALVFGLLGFSAARSVLSPLPEAEALLIANAEKITPRYDYELRAAHLAIAMKGPASRGVGSLCATFVSWSSPFQEILRTNLNRTAGFCDWIVVVYNSHGATESAIHASLLTARDRSSDSNASSSQSWLTVVEAPPKVSSALDFHRECIRYSARWINTAELGFDQCQLIYQMDQEPFNGALFSKASLLMLLLNALPKYEYVWTMDGDISLEDFDVDKFQRYHRCAFPSPPTVSQPLIKEPTQFYRYLLRKSWVNDSVLASATGFVEIQAPLFSSSFLQWFIMAFVVPLLPAIHILGSDWGVDEMYCTAAKQYKALTESHLAAVSQPACAVIIGDLAVRHHNSRSIKDTMGGKMLHLHFNYALMRIAHRCFRSYCSGGLRPWNDPLDATNNYTVSHATIPNCAF